MPEASNGHLPLPSLRATLGSWVYYITFMRCRQIADRIRTAEDIHTSKSLTELLQRQLTKNAKRIAEYLINQPQHFFNALVVGAYGGNPKFREIQLKERQSGKVPLPEYVEDAFGVLTLSGDELLFAIDGQHRVAGIREALKAEDGLNEEEVCVIFVSGVSATKRAEDEVGFQRTRRLFTTLNRYAKPVSKRDIIALDEDDVVAIVTRRLVEEYGPFVGRISVAKTKSIPASDKVSLTTVVALYDMLDIVLRDRDRGWSDFKRWRPSDEALEKYYKEAVRFWDAVMRHFPEVGELKKAKVEDPIAQKYRNRDGGHLLYRPVGLSILGRSLQALQKTGKSEKDALTSLAVVPMDLAGKPWVGLLWDASNRRMITAGENQRVAWKLMYYQAGGDLARVNTSKEELSEEYAGLLNMDVREVKLRRRT